MAIGSSNFSTARVYQGLQGKIKLTLAASDNSSASTTEAGSSTLLHVRNWQLSHSAEGVRYGQMSASGTVYEKIRPGMRSWSLDITAYWDPADNMTDDLLPGRLVHVWLYPIGETRSGVPLEAVYSGPAYVESVDRTGAYDGLIEVSINLAGAGTLAYAEQA